MIAILYPQFYGVGGIARYLDSFLENLPEDSPPIILITGDEYRQERSYRNVEILHIPFSSSRFNLLTWSLHARSLLRDLHRQGRIRWINFHWPPLIPGLLLPREIPLLLTSHTTYRGMSGRFYATQLYQSQWGKASLLVKNWMERLTFAKAARVITLSEQGRQEVLSYGFKGLVTAIPNGADVRKFTPDSRVDKDIDVLFSGRIELRKGSRAMVHLCKILVAAKPDVRICIVGYGDDDAYVHEQLDPLPANVCLTGKVGFDKMIHYYNRSHVYASTSYYEGLPGTCLEAMAMKLPVVVWNFLFYTGLVTDGMTGFVAPPNDYNAMAQSVLNLLANPQIATEMGRRGRETLVRAFDWKQLAGEILQQFKEVDCHD
jgi:glycosyltransferase involved in cell wall biosynthesis